MAKKFLNQHEDFFDEDYLSDEFLTEIGQIKRVV